MGSHRMFFIKRLFSKSVGLILATLRRIPTFAHFEYGQYVAIEKYLLQAKVGVKTSCFQRISLDKHSIRESLLRNSEYRVIEIENLKEDDLAYLENHGLSAEYIAANRNYSPLGSTGEGFSQQSAEKPDTAFQRGAFEEQSVSVVSPISGALLKTNRSLLPEPAHTIYYYFYDLDTGFYLAVGREGMGYVKLYFYFPAHQTIVLLGDRDWSWLGRWEVDQFRAFLVAQSDEVSAYLNNQTKPTVCALADHPHFAHHLWNTLTGLETIATTQYLGYVEKLIITTEPMGPIPRIFPEFKGDQVDRLTNSELIQQALANNFFLIRPGGTIVSKYIANRLYRVALENSTPDFVRVAREFRDNHWPILWATIRTGNRSWVSQAEGIASIANMLGEKFPNFALIIDGYAVPYGQSHLTPNQALLIRNEEEVVRKIRELTNDSIEIRANVGKTIFESVIYSQTVDFYLAHHGSLQNKIAWLSRKPGVVHSNRTVLSGINGTKCFYAAFTSVEDEAYPVYLDPDSVTDVPGAVSKPNLRWNDPLDHYDFDCHHAFSLLLTMLKPGQSRECQTQLD